MLTDLSLLSQVIDDYILWFVTWHQCAVTQGARTAFENQLEPPNSFGVWREKSFAELTEDQPAIEKLVHLQEQLHAFCRLILMKTPEGHAVSFDDDEAVCNKYKEFMHGLRRCEQAFSAAASGLDVLTGLRSRAGLISELDRELNRFARTGRSFCVAIMDIDHFKHINDRYGHEAGDRVLAQVADQISRHLRIHDDAFRLGGEEFVLCLKETDEVAGEQTLERLRQTLASTPLMLDSKGTPLSITASFGLSVCLPALTAAELLRRADEALYGAKRDGRNRVVVAKSPLVLTTENPPR